jgi:hypothetical protein
MKVRKNLEFSKYIWAFWMVNLLSTIQKTLQDVPTTLSDAIK